MAQTQPDRNADNHDTQTQPDRNAVTLSIAVGSQNLRTASAKEKRTPAGCPNNKQTHAWHTRN
jgi:hypothetical protein